MKKLFTILAVVALSVFATATTYAQDETVTEVTNVSEDTAAAVEEAVAEEITSNEVAEAEEKPMHYVLKEQFIAGGVGWMTPLLLCLIIGLAIVIERVIYLNLSTTNSKKLLEGVEEALKTGGIEAAKELCRNTRGPVASIFYQGLLREKEGLDSIEKSIVSYGSVQMGQLESGLSWVTLFIALAPMLGFMGTVVGMISAFDAIAAMGDISPVVVASGIKVALLTTVGGLIVAVILQLFYNYLVSKVDSIVLDMEDSSISFMDIMTKYKN